MSPVEEGLPLWETENISYFSEPGSFRPLDDDSFEPGLSPLSEAVAEPLVPYSSLLPRVSNLPPPSVLPSTPEALPTSPASHLIHSTPSPVRNLDNPPSLEATSEVSSDLSTILSGPGFVKNDAEGSPAFSTPASSRVVPFDAGRPLRLRKPVDRLDL